MRVTNCATNSHLSRLPGMELRAMHPSSSIGASRAVSSAVMKRFLLTALVLTPLLGINRASSKRLNESAAVFSEVMAAPDKGIPQDLLEKAHCMVIVPGLKTAAFVFGGK